MKKQRNIQQVKEHDKCPLSQTKEEVDSGDQKEKTGSQKGRDQSSQ